MRVLQVCPYDWNRAGGVQRHVAGLSRALVGLHHQVRIVAPGSPASSADPAVDLVGCSIGIPFNGSVAPICLSVRSALKIRALLFVGRLEPRKELPVLLRAFALLAPRFPDLSLVVIGDGRDRGTPEDLPSSVRARVVMLGAASDHILGGGTRTRLLRSRSRSRPAGCRPPSGTCTGPTPRGRLCHRPGRQSASAAASWSRTTRGTRAGEAFAHARREHPRRKCSSGRRWPLSERPFTQ